MFLTGVSPTLIQRCSQCQFSSSSVVSNTIRIKDYVIKSFLRNVVKGIWMRIWFCGGEPISKSMFHPSQMSLPPIHRCRKGGKLGWPGRETRTKDFEPGAACTSSNSVTVRKRQSNQNFGKKFQGLDWGSQNTKPLHQIYSFEFELCDIVVEWSKMAPKC